MILKLLFRKEWKIRISISQLILLYQELDRLEDDVQCEKNFLQNLSSIETKLEVVLYSKLELFKCIAWTKILLKM